jgi:hypothetical protein
MLDAALDLVEAGWAVFPCREVDNGVHKAKSPYTPHGHHDASADFETVRRWWSARPNAMVGAPVPDSLVVLDIDPRNGGSYEALTDALGALPDTLTAWSGRGDGGRHLYFLRPPGKLSAARLPDGIDLKASGYCIVPPSVHPATGDPYWWDARPIVELPWRARQMLRSKPRRLPQGTRVPSQGRGEHLVKFLDRFPTHGINDALYWAAGTAAADGILDDTFAEKLIARAVFHGESCRQASRTVESARQSQRAGGAS